MPYARPGNGRLARRRKLRTRYIWFGHRRRDANSRQCGTSRLISTRLPYRGRASRFGSLHMRKASWPGRHHRGARRTSIGYHSTEAPRYGSAPAPRCPGAGAPATAPFRLPSNSCWCSCRTGSRAQGYGDGHGGRVRVTHNTRRVGAYDRSDGLSSDRSRSASARRDSRWRRRGIGRLDAVISPVACGRVSSRIMILVYRR